jgi:ABC-type uncharacterized transport system ATPase subunit
LSNFSANSNLSTKGSDIILETHNLTKRFPQVLAIDDVDFELAKGEIHALLGENGAGKTTLAECIYGYYQADSGEIHYKGERVILDSPNAAMELGIGMVHQHFALVRPHSVLENIILGAQERGLLLDLRPARKKLLELCKDYGVELELNSQIWQLSVGQQQWVEILKALYIGIDILILDEPTAVLTPQEVDRLFNVLQRMRDDGLSIIFITHKLHEVMQISDRVTVLQKGKQIATVRTNDTSARQLARMMVGRDVLLRIEKEKVAAGDTILKIEDVRALGDHRRETLRGVSLELHKNEIHGIAGVAGNGQRELFEVLVGVRDWIDGRIFIKEREIDRLSPRSCMSLGITHIPEDRINEGVINDFSVGENLILGFQDSDLLRWGMFFLNYPTLYQLADRRISDFGIVVSSAKQKTNTLSGGNLQKLILARELSQNPQCLIANQPTRGLDVGAIEYVHQQLLALRKAGGAILLFSEDIDEILELSDKISVMYQGEIVGTFDADDVTVDEIGLLMGGFKDSIDAAGDSFSN